MKRTTLFLLWLARPAIVAVAGDFSLDAQWYTVDGGGGTTSAGELTLSSTIGQPDAGVLVAPCCRIGITGGYWSQFVEVDQPNGPRLCVRLSSTNTVLLSWPDYHVGYSVHKSVTPLPSWDDVSFVPVLLPPDFQVSLDDLAGYVLTICTNANDPAVLDACIEPDLTGFAAHEYLAAHPDAPKDRCSPAAFHATNAPAFYRLQKP